MKSVKIIVVSALCIMLLSLSACTPSSPAVEEKLKSEKYTVTEVTDDVLSLYGIEPTDIEKGIVADKGDEEFTNRVLVVWFTDSAKAREVYNKLKKNDKSRILRRGDMLALGNKEALDSI